MIGNEISRISPLHSTDIATTNGSNLTNGNLIPTILVIGSIIIIGSIILQHTQQRINKSKDNCELI